MKNLVFKMAFSAAFFAAFFVQNGCRKPEGGDEQESINLVKMTVKASFPTDTQRDFFWSDFDGDGGNAPVIDTVRLDSDGGLTTAELTFSNVSPTDGTTDLNAEIKAESAAHLVVWQPSAAGLEIISTSADGDGKPLNLTGFFSKLETGNYSLTIRLLHEPDKSNLAAPGGETDVEVTFPVVVE